MTEHVLLLRGVNVGGRAKLAMSDLRAVLTSLGYGGVRTLLQSGNAVFTTDTAPSEQAIESAIAEHTGLRTRCLLRTGDELRAVVAGHPFAAVADNGSRMLAVFLAGDPDPDLAAEHDPVALDPDHIRLGERVVYQWCPDGISQAPELVPFLDRRWKVVGTARNWNTVTKLAALV